MATLPLSEHLAWRRGSTNAINNFAGVDGEFVIDSTKKTFVILTGTAGTNYPLVPGSRSITAGTGVSLTQGGNVVSSVNLNSDFSVSANLADIFSTGKGLKVDSTSGKAEVDITLDYNAITGVVSVYGDTAKTNLLGSVTIPSHTSALQSATLQVATAGTPVNGEVSGTFIVLTFLLTNGQTSTMYVDVTSLIDIYTAGNGLQMNSLDDHKFEVKAGNGVSVDANGVHAKVKTGEAILKNDTNADGLYIDNAALHSETDQTIVSADSGNILTEGSDDGSFLKLKANGLLIMNQNGELEVITDFGTITA